MKPLPESMRPRDMGASYTPYPLPVRDDTFEFGPTRVRNIPDVHRARLQEHASRSTTTAVMDDVNSDMLFDMLDDDLAPEVSLPHEGEAGSNGEKEEASDDVGGAPQGVDPLERARAELSQGIQNRQRQANHADLSRKTAALPERYVVHSSYLSDRVECVRDVNELLTLYKQAFFREDQDHVHTAMLTDLMNTVHRQSDAEFCSVLYGIASVFDLERPIGSLLKRDYMRDAAKGDPFGTARLSVLLFQAYVSFIQRLEEYLLEDQPERLESAEVLNALLTFYSHLRFRDLTSWGSPDDDHQVHSLKSGTTGRMTTVFNLGESLYDAIMTRVANGQFVVDPSTEATFLISMLGGVVAADTKAPDSRAINALISRITQLPLTLAEAEQAWLNCVAARITSPQLESMVVSLLSANRGRFAGQRLFGVTCLSDVGITALSKEASSTHDGDESARWRWQCDEIRATVTTLSFEHEAALTSVEGLPDRDELEAELWRQYVRVGLAVREAVVQLPLPFSLPLCKELNIDSMLLAPLRGFRDVLGTPQGGSLCEVSSEAHRRMLALQESATSKPSISPFRSTLECTDALRRCADIRVLHSTILVCERVLNGSAVLNTLLRELLTSQSAAVIINTSTLMEINRQAHSNPSFGLRKVARTTLDTIAAFGASMPDANLFITPLSSELLLKGDCTVDEQGGVVRIVQHARMPLTEGQSVWLTRQWLEDHGAPNAKSDLGIDKDHHDASLSRVMGQAAGSSPASQDADFIRMAPRLRNFRGGTKFGVALPVMTQGSEVTYEPAPQGSFQRMGWHDNLAEKARRMKPHYPVLDRKTTVRSYNINKTRYWGNKDGGARDRITIGGDRLAYGTALASPDVRLAGLGFYAPGYPALDERVLSPNHIIMKGKRWDREATENAQMAQDSWGL